MQRLALLIGWIARYLLPVGVVLVTASLALGQGKALPSVPGGSPFGSYAWILDLGVPGVLLSGFVMLWKHFQAKDKEHQGLRDKWAEDKSKLKEEHEQAQDRIWEEARKDKAELRKAFEDEKAEMRRIYTAKIDELQTKFENESKERREESLRLQGEQTTLTREIVLTAQAMSESLKNNTRVVEEFNQKRRS